MRASTVPLKRLLTIRWIVTLAAAAACIAAYAWLSTGSANPVTLKNAAGTLSVSNDKSGSAIFTLGAPGSPVAPGASSSGTVTIGNGGDTTGAMTLSQTGGNALASQLDLLVQDLSGGGTVYSGKLGTMPDRLLGNFAPGASRQYKFTVTVPGTLDDSFQGGSANVTFNWTLSAPDPTVTTVPAGGNTGANGGNAGANGGSGGNNGTAALAAVGVKLGGATKQKPFKQHNQVYVNVQCAGPCTLLAGGTIGIPGGAAKTYRFAQVEKILAQVGKTTLKLKVPKKALKPLKKLLAKKKTAKAKIKVTATVGAHSTTGQRTVVLKR